MCTPVRRFCNLPSWCRTRRSGTADPTAIYLLLKVTHFFHSPCFLPRSPPPFPLHTADHRGNFHALWHAFDLSEKERKSCTNSTVSAHTFSLDGINWHASETQPYTTQVATAPLASPPWATADRIESNLVTVSTRERPKLLFNSSGHMTHLVNGVSGAPQCGDDVKPPHACANCKLKYWDYTLIAPLDV